MAQAAWTRPGLRLSSWSCVGPRRRTSSVKVESNDDRVSSLTEGETSEGFLATSDITTATFKSSELSSVPGSCTDGTSLQSSVDSSFVDDEDVMQHNSREERMTEAELWQQLEHELYDQVDREEDDIVKEIREEEAAASAEVSDGETESSSPKEVHRFFPPGRIMHIVPLVANEMDNEESNGDPSSSLEDSQPSEMKVGIFLTPRSLYSKLRLSQTMISDHFMPVYRRHIEKLIVELEEDGSDLPHSINAT